MLGPVFETPVQRTTVVLDQDVWRELSAKVARCRKSASKVLEEETREYLRGPDGCEDKLSLRAPERVVSTLGGGS